MTTTSEGFCDRCGQYGRGASKLMFYRWLRIPPGDPVTREFICDRCRTRMKWYAVIGFSLLLLVVGVLVAAVVLLVRPGGSSW